MLWGRTCCGAFRTGAASNKLPWIIFSHLPVGDCPQGVCNDRAQAIFCKMAQSLCWLAPAVCLGASSQLLSISVQGPPRGPRPESGLVSATWLHLVRRLLLHWGPASVVSPSETFVLPRGQIHTSGMPGEKCQHDPPSPPPARMSRRPGRAGSRPDSRSLKHTCTLSEKNTAGSDNLSSCLMTLDSS